MISFIVMISADGELKGLGSHEFAVAPRIGEFVTTNDKAGIGQAYRVKAVIYPLDPTMDAAGDLILEYISTDLELMKSL